MWSIKLICRAQHEITILTLEHLLKSEAHNGQRLAEKDNPCLSRWLAYLSIKSLSVPSALEDIPMQTITVLSLILFLKST